ncbi:MAG: hypothetical protein GY819_18085 [Planctomycetaceae bacterium]|nr:hypothetical protein [Planctomycetaceae bacterium]
MRHFQHFILGLAFAGFLISGCADPKKEAKKPVGGADAHQDHHDEHRHGPKGGEVFDVAGTDMEVECVAKYGQNLVIFNFYGDDGKTEQKIKCKMLLGSFKKGDVQMVEIPAVDAGDDGMAARFEIEDEDFALARKTAGVKIEFEIDGKKHTVEVPKDPHG